METGCNKKRPEGGRKPPRKNNKGKKGELITAVGKKILEKPNISLQEIQKNLDREVTIRSLQAAYTQLKQNVLSQSWLPGFSDEETERLRLIIPDRERSKRKPKMDDIYLPIPLYPARSRLTMSRNAFLRQLIGHYEYDNQKKIYRLRENDVARLSNSRDIPRSFRPPFSEGVAGKKGKGGGHTGLNQKFALLN